MYIWRFKVGRQYSNRILPTSNMLNKFLLLTLVSQGMGFRNNNHHDHPEDECVDVSYYSQVEYNTTTEKICSYRVERSCQPKSQKVCVNLPSTECTMEAGYTCDTQKREETVRCDETQTNTFTPKKCVPNGFKTLIEIKQVPECKNVTKQVCDSKWEITAEGQKVFASNENCRDKTWEQCELVDKVIEEHVPSLACDDDAVLTYLTPLVKEELTTLTGTTCSATGGAVCGVSTANACTEVEWTECEEWVKRECEEVSVKIPFQEFEHLLRCKVGH